MKLQLDRLTMGVAPGNDESAKLLVHLLAGYLMAAICDENNPHPLGKLIVGLHNDKGLLTVYCTSLERAKSHEAAIKEGWMRVSRSERVQFLDAMHENIVG
ncbi:hypothetical protein [Paraburkholderia sp. SIMBA_054]|uniref:hypothetical protein n=1 Tax=Paraburkholderia sp. SIMBA_054 TaxID=3085795 RepID=UPI00397D0F29